LGSSATFVLSHASPQTPLEDLCHQFCRRYGEALPKHKWVGFNVILPQRRCWWQCWGTHRKLSTKGSPRKTSLCSKKIASTGEASIMDLINGILYTACLQQAVICRPTVTNSSWERMKNNKYIIVHQFDPTPSVYKPTANQRGRYITPKGTESEVRRGIKVFTQTHIACIQPCTDFSS